MPGQTPSIAPALTDFIERVTARLGALASGLPESLRPEVEALANRPGKCLRAVLLYACSRFGHAEPHRIVRLGSLIELLHLASLLHDDVVDRADLRRGHPAARLVVGEERAVLAGLACFAIAGMEAATLGVEQVIGQAAARLAYGEVLDVERAFDTSLAVADYLELAERKTGELFRLACVLGGAEAGAPDPVVDALGRFGLDFGVAFQILDDCLDLSANLDGKTAGTDYVMGLFGAPVICALATDYAGKLRALLLSQEFSSTDLPAVRELLVSSGGLATASRLARAKYDRALETVRRLSDSDPGGAVDTLTDATDAFWKARQ
jgi:geranylgeranyl pyrophosphate synthase